MPLHKTFLLQACKLSALLLLAPLCLPLLIPGVLFVTLCSFFIIPTLCFIFPVYLFYVFLNWFSIRYSIQYVLDVSFHFCARILDSPTITSNEEIINGPRREEGEDRAVSIEFDPSESSHVEESEDEKATEEKCKAVLKSNEEGSSSDETWRTHIFKFKSFQCGHDSPFYRTLNYWRSQEAERNYKLLVQKCFAALTMVTSGPVGDSALASSTSTSSNRWKHDNIYLRGSEHQQAPSSFSLCSFICTLERLLPI